MVKEPYFEYGASMYYTGANTRDVLESVAYNYVSRNPAEELKSRVHYTKSFNRRFKGEYMIDFDKMYPEAENGDWAYAIATAIIDREKAQVVFKSKSPTWIYINGKEIFSTTPIDEALGQGRFEDVSFKKGRNTFFIKCRKNDLGFGCDFGDNFIKGYSIKFFNPFEEHLGKSGWAYSKLFKKDIFETPETFPQFGGSCGELWLPSAKLKKNIHIDRLYSGKAGYIYSATYLKNNGVASEYEFKGNCKDDVKIFIDGENVFYGNGEIKFKKVLNSGRHNLICEINKIDLKNTCFSFETDCEYGLCGAVKGGNGKWLYLGALKNPCEEIYGGIDFKKIYSDGDENVYWLTDEEDTEVKLSCESDVFGDWNYPIGVALYGLCETAREFGDEKLLEYVNHHIKICTDSLEYAKWATKRYGRANLLEQIMDIDALDFCGSCGNALLDILPYEGNCKNLADLIADYMKNKQERLENGMFFRKAENTLHRNSIWADDLYMSVPFMCRYYKATGDESFLNDAVLQFKCFKEYLYMPEMKLMSHTYNVDANKKNLIPWGRGNGWVIFSLSELLMAMPQEHREYKAMVDFYEELCKGYLNYQDECGLWHQVLDEKESFFESSSSAMFVCAFARGVLNGWLKNDKYVKAAYRGWEGLLKCCIKKNGDIYGVCTGSALSFRREYYKEELLARTNDTHGIGIILLAGVEIYRLLYKREQR